MAIDLQEYGEYRGKIDRMHKDLYEGDEPVIETWKGYLAVQQDRDKRAAQRLIVAGLFISALVGLMEWRPWHHDPPPIAVVPVSAEPNNYDSMRHENRAPKLQDPQQHQQPER